MLKKVKFVRDKVWSLCEGPHADLETILAAFKEITVIDQVYFATYDTPPINPVWGRFRKWGHVPGVYAAEETVVEIAYAKHLSEDWKRFVVCKELCHFLEEIDGQHNVHENTIDDLVAGIVLRATASGSAPYPQAYKSEVLAELGALEILFPLSERKVLAVEGSNSLHMVPSLVTKYKLPERYVALGLNDGYNRAVESLMDNG